MVLRRLKALEQEDNNGPERRELFKKRKKHLRDILCQQKDILAQEQLPWWQKRFEQEVSLGLTTI